MRLVKAAVSVAVLGGALSGVAPSLAARVPSTPAGGAVKLFATPSNGLHATILMTGAIGDYGNALTIDKSGTPDTNGNYVKVTLQKGGFEINSTTLDAKANKAQPTFDAATCSAWLSVAGPVTLFNGTGLYKGIAGTLTVSETAVFILARYTSGKNKGRCNTTNNAQPLKQYASITGAGTVSFS